MDTTACAQIVQDRDDDHVEIPEGSDRNWESPSPLTWRREPHHRQGLPRSMAADLIPLRCADLHAIGAVPSGHCEFIRQNLRRLIETVIQAVA